MLETINAVAQSVAALGVIASLVFVGVQVSQNTRAVRAQTFHAITDSFNAVNLVIGGEAQVATTVRKGLAGLDTLTPDELMQFNFMALSAVRVHETLYYQSKIGVAERELWEAETKSLQVLLAWPGIQHWWRVFPPNFTPEFRAMVEQMLSAPGGGPAA
jgi:hypothetical protein